MTLDTIIDQAEGLLNSRALPYLLAAVLALLWWLVHSVVTLLRRGRHPHDDRPRRRLPLD